MNRNYLEILSVTSGQYKTWTRIGTAFPTKDGKGYRLKLDLLPLGPDAEILLFPPKPKEEAPEQ